LDLGDKSWTPTQMRNNMQLIDIPEQIYSSELDQEILEIFVEEVGDINNNIITHFKAWKNDQANSESLKELRRSFHTLKGSGRLVGATVIGELGWCFENMLNKVIDGTLSRNNEMLSLLEQIEKMLPSMLEQFQHNKPPPDEVVLFISKADYLTHPDDNTTTESNKAKPELPLESLDLAENELDLLDLSQGDLDLDGLDFPEGELELDALDLPEGYLELDAIPIESPETEYIDSQLKSEATEQIACLKKALKNIETKLPVPIEHDIINFFQKLKDSSHSLNFYAISEIAAPLEDYARTLLERQTLISPKMLAFFNEAIQLIENLLKGTVNDAQQQQTLLHNIQLSLESLSAPNKEPTPSTADEEAADELKAIFLDEADEIIEKTQSMLERWIAAPNNMPLMKELQHQLHTLKGGARMMGIAPMGDLSHNLEDVLKRIVEGTAQSNNRLQEIVQSSVDELAAMLEAVRNHIALDIPTDLIKQINAAAKGEDESKKTFDAPQKKTDVPQETGSVDKIQEQNEAPADSADERIRVKATLIDKLTNFAGELSISRAHMGQQQGEFKKNLVEMEQTVVRLREQLRLFEIENDAQIRSHFDDNDKEFDPLELDCFSIIQQLSRSLTESVDDLVNIQDYLKTLTRQSDSLLVQQSRIGAELQDGIMRTRMIPFAKISPRLQRIVRGEVREQKKPVKFIINGENIEFERTVLERVVTPLEHMLRNAIGHGIEDAKTRQKSGKSSVANITIDISREGAELIIKLSDDGAGLNLPAIRQKAEERGLIQANTVVNDHELKQLILKPGFTTAKKLTQSQGRGVGMDIVNTDIKKLSGNLQIQSKTGEGTSFEIRLPLSLTITQALLVQIGEETMAVPINYLDAVMRTPRSEVLGEANEVRYYKYMDQKYRVFHLGELLGFGQVASVDSPLIPTLLVHVADRRVALLVDAIEGSKEIVVKPVGPQIDAIRWIAGATILGDGRVVLVLNMPIIVREESTLQSISSQRDAIVQAEKPVVKTVMVVDDSITVRKVTASLLKRQGMEVITAKDGLDAVAKLRENIPDLILLDVEMPRMDGYELATRVRNNPDWKELPIIMITTRTGDQHLEKAKKIGINCHLGKPYKESVLLENINALLGNKFH